MHWSDGTEAFLISSPDAHDADGGAVATSLSVSENNVISLTVHHKMSGVVYPVVAGVGWEGGFQTYSATVTPEEIEYTFKTATEEFLSAPPEVYVSDSSDPCEPGEACVSSTPYKYLKKFGARQCEEGTWPIPGCSVWEQKLKGFFWYNGKKAWETREPDCPQHGSPGVDVNTPRTCAWVGPTWQKYGGGHHITAQALYSVTYAKVAYTAQHHLSVYAYGDGYWNDHDTECVCNPLPTE